MTVDLLGRVLFRECKDDLAICYSLDFKGAPEKYQLVITLDEIDFANLLESGVMEHSIAAKRSGACTHVNK